MTPEHARIGEAPNPSAPVLPVPDRWLEVWIGADETTDSLLVLRSVDGGGCALVDPHNGWAPLRRFGSYEAAWRWLTGEAYAIADGRCAVR